MATPIQRVHKDSTPSLLNSKLANQLIDSINGLQAMIVSPSGYGKLEADGKGGSILNLEPLAKVIQDLSKALAAINKTDAQDNAAGGDVAGISDRLDAVIRSINSSTLSIVCNGDGTITGTLTFPGMPEPANA